MSYTDKEGNGIDIQEENGLILITPKGKSTIIYTLKEIIEMIEKSKEE